MTDPEDRDWHRADYLLRGDYCPLYVVRDHLEYLREELGARYIIHVAHDHELIMRSLSWIVGPEDDEGTSTWIRAADYRNSNGAVNEAFLAAAGSTTKHALAVLDEIRATDLADRILQVRHRKEPPGTEPMELRGLAWSGLLLSHTGEPWVQPWDGEARSVLLVHPPLPAQSVPSPKDRTLKDLGVMLKCTAEANARRDYVVMQKVGDELTMIDLYSDDAFERMTDQALRLACDLTGSSGGAVYTLSTDPLGFGRNTERSGPGFHYPDRITYDKNGNTVSWAVSRHRAYEQMDSSQSVQNLARAVSADGGVELVTPIAGPLANTWAPAVGAIVLFHDRDDVRPYGAYDRSLVRNIALRLALARTVVATREMASAISALRATSPQRLQLEATDESVSPTDRTWPRDISLVVSRFAEPLRRLAHSTQSHSATLRIALPHRGTNHPSGLGLFRVAAYPPEVMHHDFPVIGHEGPGLHWDVMRTGEERYAPEQQNPDVVRPGTKSTLCVPVRVEGILAGTLNLESPVAHNYTPFLPLVLALSGGLGRTLADARAELEGNILDRAAQALDERHSSSRELERIKGALAEIPESADQQLLLAQADAMLGLMQEFRSRGAREESPRSLWRLLEDQVRRHDLDISGFDRNPPLSFAEPLEAQACSCIVTMLASVLSNLNQHSSVDAYDDARQVVPRIAFDETELQGVTHAVIKLESLSSNYLDEQTGRELYRYPIGTQEAELRLGTYIAGINARRVGGRIHATVLDDHRTLQTTIMIPVDALRRRDSRRAAQ